MAALVDLPAGARMAVKGGANRSEFAQFIEAMAETLDGSAAQATSIAAG